MRTMDEAQSETRLDPTSEAIISHSVAIEGRARELTDRLANVLHLAQPPQRAVFLSALAQMLAAMDDTLTTLRAIDEALLAAASAVPADAVAVADAMLAEQQKAWRAASPWN